MWRQSLVIFANLASCEYNLQSLWIANVTVLVAFTMFSLNYALALTWMVSTVAWSRPGSQGSSWLLFTIVNTGGDCNSLNILGMDSCPQLAKHSSSWFSPMTIASHLSNVSRSWFTWHPYWWGVLLGAFTILITHRNFILKGEDTFFPIIPIKIVINQSSTRVIMGIIGWKIISNWLKLLFLVSEKCKFFDHECFGILCRPLIRGIEHFLGHCPTSLLKPNMVKIFRLEV